MHYIELLDFFIQLFYFARVLTLRWVDGEFEPMELQNIEEEIRRARLRALRPFPWEQGPMAAIFGQAFEMPWLQPLALDNFAAVSIPEPVAEDARAPAARLDFQKLGRRWGPKQRTSSRGSRPWSFGRPR